MGSGNHPVPFGAETTRYIRLRALWIVWYRQITVRVSGVTELTEPVCRSSCARSGERFETNGLEITRWRDELSISEGDAWIMIDLIGE